MKRIPHSCGDIYLDESQAELRRREVYPVICHKCSQPVISDILEEVDHYPKYNYPTDTGDEQ